MRLCLFCNKLKEESEYFFDREECNKCAYERRSSLVSPIKPNPKEDGCLMCGKPVQVGRDKYCSGSCLRKSQNEKSKEWYKRNMPR